MAAGWAVAGDTPFTWTKQVAAELRRDPQRHGRPLAEGDQGEGRGPLAVPPRHRRRADDPRGGRPAGAEERSTGPSRRRSRASAWPTPSTTPKAKSRHKTQYFEIFGNRAIYHDGWLAGTVHRAPWESKPRAPLDEDTWELYDTRSDFSLVERPRGEEPGQAEGAAGPLPEGGGRSTTCCPSTTGSSSGSIAELVGRPDLMAGRTSLTLYEGMTGMSENVFINVKNRSHDDHRRGRGPEGRRRTA